jgi:ammonia channel protein AmtB
LLALGLFARVPGQWLAQLVGIATLIGFVLPLTYGLNWLLNRLYPYRVAPEGERQGMDLYELGAELIRSFSPTTKTSRNADVKLLTSDSQTPQGFQGRSPCLAL